MTLLAALVILVPGLLAFHLLRPPRVAPLAPELRFTRLPPDHFRSDSLSSPSASWADIDGDGDEDLYVLNGYGSLEPRPVPQPNDLYRNDGHGRFTRLHDHPLVQDTTFSGSSTWGDYDNDGDLDLFVANQRGADNVLFRNLRGSYERVAGTPMAGDGGRSFSAVWIDIDNDGLLDLHVLNGRDGEAGEVDFLYRNRGEGGFSAVRDAAWLEDALPSGGAAWGDYDGDGDADLFLPVYSTATTNRLYRNDGDWSFSEVAAEAGLSTDPLPYSPSASVGHWVDYDNDGDLDLFVGNTGGTIDFLYRNDGNGSFRRVTAGRLGLDATYVSDAIWADLENDGDVDLVIAVWGGASQIYLNDGTGAFYPVEGGDFGSAVDFASSVSTADFDLDGDLDLLLTQWPINEAGGAPNLLYRNDSPTGNWLKVDLAGTLSNASGVGATIAVTARVDRTVRTQLRLVTARSSWRSANGLTQHFGLGDATTVRRIEVRWPSGTVDVITGPIEANQALRLVESARESSRQGFGR